MLFLFCFVFINTLNFHWNIEVWTKCIPTSIHCQLLFLSLSPSVICNAVRVNVCILHNCILRVRKCVVLFCIRQRLKWGSCENVSAYWQWLLSPQATQISKIHAHLYTMPHKIRWCLDNQTKWSQTKIGHMFNHHIHFLNPFSSQFQLIRNKLAIWFLYEFGFWAG